MKAARVLASAGVGGGRRPYLEWVVKEPLEVELELRDLMLAAAAVEETKLAFCIHLVDADDVHFTVAEDEVDVLYDDDDDDDKSFDLTRSANEYGCDKSSEWR